MQVTQASAFCILLCACSLGAAQLTLQICGDENSDITCSFFFDKVDKAFRQQTVLYTLRKSFFPTQGAPPTLFNVFMTLNIESVPDIPCSDPYFEEISISSPPSMSDVCSRYTCDSLQLEWEHQWSKTIVGFIIEREDLDLLQDTNFVAFSTSTFNSFDTSVFSQEGDNLESNDEMDNTSLASAGRETIRFLLMIDYLPCRPDDNVLLTAWEDILPWIELYAKNSDNLENVEYAQDERGFAFRENSERRQGLTLPLLTIIHILLNTVFALAATYLLSKYHRDLNQVKGKQYQVVASMYWAVVFMCFVGCVVIIAGNGYLYYALVFFGEGGRDAFAFRITSDITVGVLAVIELVVSIGTSHDPTFFIPLLIRRILCCNQCCYCCGSQSRRHILRKAILGVAMWIIMLFLQLVISSLLPSAIVVIINPVPSLAFLSIMVALFFCMVVFIAYFLNAFEGNYISVHKLKKEERRKSSLSLETLRRNPGAAGDWARNKLVLIAQAFIFLVIFGIVTLIIIIYLNFVKAGADTNSTGGLIFSLIPSVALGGITWAAKKHLFREFEEEEEDDKSSVTSGEDAVEESKSLLQIGGFSIGSKSRRRSTKKIRRENKNGTDAILEILPTSPSSNGVHNSSEAEHSLATTTIDFDVPQFELHTTSESGSCDRQVQDGHDDEHYGERNGVEVAITMSDLTDKKGKTSEVGISAQKKHISFVDDEHDAEINHHE